MLCREVSVHRRFEPGGRSHRSHDFQGKEGSCRRRGPADLAVGDSLGSPEELAHLLERQRLRSKLPNRLPASQAFLERSTPPGTGARERENGRHDTVWKKGLEAAARPPTPKCAIAAPDGKAPRVRVARPPREKALEEPSAPSPPTAYEPEPVVHHVVEDGAEGEGEAGRDPELEVCGELSPLHQNLLLGDPLRR